MAPSASMRIAEGEGRVVQVLRADGGVADLEDALDQVVVAHLGADVVEADREVLVLHLSGEHVVERPYEAAGAEDVPPAAGHEERREEGEPVDVVPVGVADQDRPAGGGPPASAASCTRRSPSARAPVPQSRTSSVPPSVRTSTHDVFPPYRTVPGPGVGTDPRVPQNRIRTFTVCRTGSVTVAATRIGNDGLVGRCR